MTELYYKDITFATPYASPPKVLVTPQYIKPPHEAPKCTAAIMNSIQCYPENITTTGFRLRCGTTIPYDGSQIPAGLCMLNWWALYPARASWIALDTGACGAQGENDVQPRQCPGAQARGFCSDIFTKSINFASPFSTVPHVLVAPEKVTDDRASNVCLAENAMPHAEGLHCFPTNITKTGFLMRCSGQVRISYCVDAAQEFPLGTQLINNTMQSPTAAGWLALESKPSCPITSDHNLTADQCDGTITGDRCGGKRYRDVTFPTPFATVPKIIVSPETIQTYNCPASDTLYCNAVNVTTTGFRAECWGSPPYNDGYYTTCGEPYSDHDNTQTIAADFGYLAIASDCDQPIAAFSSSSSPVPSSSSEASSAMSSAESSSSSTTEYFSSSSSYLLFPPSSSSNLSSSSKASSKSSVSSSSSNSSASQPLSASSAMSPKSSAVASPSASAQQTSAVVPLASSAQSIVFQYFWASSATRTAVFSSSDRVPLVAAVSSATQVRISEMYQQPLLAVAQSSAVAVLPLALPHASSRMLHSAPALVAGTVEQVDVAVSSADIKQQRVAVQVVPLLPNSSVPNPSQSTAPSDFAFIPTLTTKSSAHAAQLYKQAAPSLVAGVTQEALPVATAPQGVPGKTGPAVVIYMISGAAAGYAAIRKRKRSSV